MSQIATKFDLVNNFAELQNLNPDEKSKILDYCQEMHTLVTEKFSIQFKNTGYLHAAVVMSNIFLHSQKNIKIFAGNFNGEVSGISIWKKTIEYSFDNNPELKIDVILEKKPQSNSVGFSTIKALQCKNQNRVSISLLDSSGILFNAKAKTPFHFTIGDENMYRFETDTKEFQAVCNFDDSETTSRLSNYFDIMKLRTTQI